MDTIPAGVVDDIMTSLKPQVPRKTREDFSCFAPRIANSLPTRSNTLPSNTNDSEVLDIGDKTIKLLEKDKLNDNITSRQNSELDIYAKHKTAFMPIHSSNVSGLDTTMGYSSIQDSFKADQQMDFNNKTFYRMFNL